MAKINLLALLLLGGSLFGQQVNQDIVPASTGLNLGHINQEWNGFFQNLSVSGVANLGSFSFFLTESTVALLPPAALSPGKMFLVIDGQSSTDCAIGGGVKSVVCYSNGTIWQSVSVGGTGIPGGSNFQLQTNAGGASFGGVTNVAAGSALTSNGTGAFPVFQQKATYDVRDQGFTCNGTTDNTSAAVSLVSAIAGNPAKITAPAQSPCGMGDFVWPSNIELDFSNGWQIKTLTDSSTTPGTAVYNSTAGATGHCESNNTTTTCAMSVTATANDTYIIGCMRGFSSGAGVVTSNVAGDIVLPLPGSDTGFVSITQGWYVPNVVSGAHTLTATFPANLVGACTAMPVTGLGPTPVVDTGSTTCPNVSANSPYACAASLTAGDFVAFWGGQNNTSETCTGTGGGVTLLSGAAGCSTNTASNMGMAYLNSAVGGSFTPSISFTASPAGHFWSAETIGLRPGTATNFILGQVDCAANCFVNATVSGTGISFVGNKLPMRVKPDWWGASSSASASTNAAAIQAAVSAAFPLNNQQYNKVLDLSGGIYSINAEIKFYGTRGNQAARAEVDCGAGGGITQTSSNLRIIDGQGIAYFRFDNCQWQGSASSTNTLIDLDWTTGTAPTGTLKPQFIDFYNNAFVGNGLVDVGVLIAKSGGNAQGSNINFWNPAFQSFTGSCLQIGGDNTGRNAGRNGATNAIQIATYGGDMQGCGLYGLSNYAGQLIFVDGTTMENGFTTQTGFDLFTAQCIGTQPAIIARGVRSESRRLAAGCNLDIRDSATIMQSVFPNPGGTQPVGTIISSTTPGGDGKYYRVTANAGPFGGVGLPTALEFASSGTPTTVVNTNYKIAGSITTGSFQAGETVTQAVTGSAATLIGFAGGNMWVQATPSGSPDNSHIWTGGTSGATFTPTAVPVQTAYTVNAFTGFRATLSTGTSGACYGVITSNTATSITVSSWLTNFSGVACTSPALGTTFLVEPNWGTQFSSPAGMTWVDQAENGIDGQSGLGLTNTVLENVDVPGDRIAIGSSSSVQLRNVTTTRNDWANLVSGNPYQVGNSIQNKLDVYNRVTGNSSGAVVYQNWQLPRLTGGRTYFSGPFQENIGARAFVWECGDPGGGNPCSDKWIGGAQDFTAGNTFGRNILPFCCLLGPATPQGTDQNATQSIVGLTGGISTGAGTPGDLGFYFSTASGSGTTVNTAALAWSVKGNTGNLVGSGTQTISSAGDIVAGPNGSASTATFSSCETSSAPTTLNTGATTTDTGLNCLPANAIIDSVVYRITTTITTAANFTIGDATTAARFCSTQSTLTVGTTGVCFVQADQTGAAGPRQASAVKVRVTTNVNPGAGAIRLIVYYHTWTPPTS